MCTCIHVYTCTCTCTLYYYHESLTSSTSILPALNDVPLRVAEDQFTEGRHEQIQRYIGDRKGIQGHQNSCYLDASVFGLFALTDAFDEMFLQALSSNTADQSRKEIAELLWKGIVNPLRKYAIYSYTCIIVYSQGMLMILPLLSVQEWRCPLRVSDGIENQT